MGHRFKSTDSWFMIVHDSFKVGIHHWISDDQCCLIILLVWIPCSSIVACYCATETMKFFTSEFLENLMIYTISNKIWMHSYVGAAWLLSGRHTTLRDLARPRFGLHPSSACWRLQSDGCQHSCSTANVRMCHCPRYVPTVNLSHHRLLHESCNRQHFHRALRWFGSPVNVCQPNHSCRRREHSYWACIWPNHSWVQWHSGELRPCPTCD